MRHINMTVIIMKKDKNQLPRLNPEQIIGYCQQNFINIVPTPCSTKRKSSSLKIIVQNNNEAIVYFFTADYSKLCSHFGSQDKISIIQNFRDLDDFENLIHHRNRTKLPFYQVDCKDFLGRQLVIKIPPQVSLYQDPLLFYNYSRLAQQQLFCNLPIMKRREQRIQIIKHHIPFLDPNFIPIVQQRFQTKAKFNQIEDRLLLIMLSLHQKKDISQFKNIYFPSRTQSQIRNRAKNLCAKQMVNSIKTLKQNEYLPLTQQQRRVFTKAYLRYGPRWSVIAKYYSLRSAQLLQGQFSNCVRLQKLRKSYNIEINYPSMKDIIQKQLSKEVMQNENQQQQSVGMDIQQVQQRVEEQVQPVYKIINHLTFLYQEI